MNLNDVTSADDLFIIAGPCVAESEQLCLHIAERLKKCSDKHDILIVFKASYDKANRTSAGSFRGPGKERGLALLRKVKEEMQLPVLTDVHIPADCSEVAAVADILQIPAFLCRQTDLLEAAGATGRIVNIKKGQFMAPSDMKYAAQKVGPQVWLTERGTFFGYNRLVVDYAGMLDMLSMDMPLIFDATHSVQAPGGADGKSGGNREQALPLARAALACGVSGLFFEVHPDPDKALCDGANSLQLDTFESELPRLIELSALIKEFAD
ncbi:MAG: 3-deoxy-8-phosphooctulonate synthase [Chitinivibrionales bacterium]|nr:3-deoxy-8-phosphooctulonate synthase [Chitinivibrionales bacterium]